MIGADNIHVVPLVVFIILQLTYFIILYLYRNKKYSLIINTVNDAGCPTVALAHYIYNGKINEDIFNIALWDMNDLQYINIIKDITAANNKKQYLIVEGDNKKINNLSSEYRVILDNLRKVWDESRCFIWNYENKHVVDNIYQSFKNEILTNYENKIFDMRISELTPFFILSTLFFVFSLEYYGSVSLALFCLLIAINIGFYNIMKPCYITPYAKELLSNYLNAKKLSSTTSKYH